MFCSLEMCSIGISTGAGHITQLATIGISRKSLLWLFLGCDFFLLVLLTFKMFLVCLTLQTSSRRKAIFNYYSRDNTVHYFWKESNLLIISTPNTHYEFLTSLNLSAYFPFSKTSCEKYVIHLWMVVACALILNSNKTKFCIYNCKEKIKVALVKRVKIKASLCFLLWQTNYNTWWPVFFDNKKLKHFTCDLKYHISSW